MREVRYIEGTKAESRKQKEGSRKKEDKAH